MMSDKKVALMSQTVTMLPAKTMKMMIVDRKRDAQAGGKEMRHFRDVF